MVSPTARLLIRLLAVFYAALGLVLFLAPFWASQNFAWKVSPWIAMTIGGWCIGNAYFAWKAAHVWRWNDIYPNLVYLWLFGILQTLVLIIFRDKLLLSGPAAWLYLATLTVNLVCVGFGVREWYRTRPQIKSAGKSIASWVRAVLIFDVTFALLVTLVMLIKPEPIIAGDVMPEKVSLFTVYAFAMFYLSLVLAGLSALKTKNAAPVYYLGQGAVVFMIPTTIAAILFFANVNFREEIGAFLYITLYIAVLIAAAAIVWFYRHHNVK